MGLNGATGTAKLALNQRWTVVLTLRCGRAVKLCSCSFAVMNAALTSLPVFAYPSGQAPTSLCADSVWELQEKCYTRMLTVQSEVHAQARESKYSVNVRLLPSLTD